MKPFELEGKTMEEQASELLTRFGLRHVREVRMNRFWINGVETVVGPGKYYSALLLQYLSEVAAASRDLITVAQPMGGALRTFTMSAETREITADYFKEARCEDAKRPDTKHTTIRDLLYGGLRETTVCLETFELSAIEELVMSCMSYNDMNVRVPDLARWFPNESAPNSVLEVAKRVSERVFALANRGAIRAAHPSSDGWVVNTWFKPGILLYFRSHDNVPMGEGYFDKVPLKFADYTEERFRVEGLRIIPTSFARDGVYMGPGTVMMNHAAANVGFFIENDGMIDSFALGGSCAQVGNKVHLSMHAGVGGVLEPAGATPVIVEDNVFIGAGTHLVEGFYARKGAIFGAGGNYTASTPILDLESGEIYKGSVPEYAVVIPGTIPYANGLCSVNAGIIIKRSDEKTRSKVKPETLLHELLSAA